MHYVVRGKNYMSSVKSYMWWQVITATNRNGHNRNGHKPKGHKPERPQPKRPQTETATRDDIPIYCKAYEWRQSYRIHTLKLAVGGYVQQNIFRDTKIMFNELSMFEMYNHTIPIGLDNSKVANS